MDGRSVTSDRPKRREPSVPRGVAIALVLLSIESAGWMLLGTLLVVGGVIVLCGGSGLPGIVNDPIGGWVVGVGIVIAMIGGWGLLTGWSMRQPSRSISISVLLFCGAWIAVGVLLVRIATTPIPGIVTITVNAVVFIALLAPSSSRATFHRTTITASPGRSNAERPRVLAPAIH